MGPAGALSSGGAVRLFTRLNGSGDVLWQLVYFTSQAVVLLFMSNEQSSAALTVKLSHREEPASGVTQGSWVCKP